jgi:hypothetical protein
VVVGRWFTGCRNGGRQGVVTDWPVATNKTINETKQKEYKIIIINKQIMNIKITIIVKIIIINISLTKQIKIEIINN